MKSVIAFPITLVVLTVLSANAAIITGPITNPANGHDYYLLAPNSWSACEAEAEQLGGKLVVIKNEAEQRWVFSTFGNYGGIERGLWIGLHRKSPGGAFVWIDGTPVDYTDWYPGEPNDAGGRENCAHMRWDPASPGTWNDLVGDSALSGVVEVAAKSPKAAKVQRALIGAWYQGGSAERPCYFADAGKAIFAINEVNSSGRVIAYQDGAFYVIPWQVRGEILKDKIIWSNGTWWSREPNKYEDTAGRDSIRIEDLNRAAGKQYDTPDVGGFLRSGQ